MTKKWQFIAILCKRAIAHRMLEKHALRAHVSKYFHTCECACNFAPHTLPDQMKMIRCISEYERKKSKAKCRVHERYSDTMITRISHYKCSSICFFTID